MYLPVVTFEVLETEDGRSGDCAEYQDENFRVKEKLLSAKVDSQAKIPSLAIQRERAIQPARLSEYAMDAFERKNYGDFSELEGVRGSGM
jgi:hypothetical protein